MFIRKATSNDIKELINIRIDYLKEDYGNLTSEQIDKLKKQLPEYYSNHIERDMIDYIAEENNQVIASGFLVIIEKLANPAFMSGNIGHILNVYAKPQHRKKGVAGKLLKCIIDEGKKMNLSYLKLKATKSGVNLYKKLGFIEEHSSYIPMKFEL